MIDFRIFFGRIFWIFGFSDFLHFFGFFGFLDFLKLFLDFLKIQNELDLFLGFSENGPTLTVDF